jgi:succinate dehydrogenase / fumarate reductase iron-sulfur subunit
MKVNLKIWRQAGPKTPGRLVDYSIDNVDPSQSFLEMLDMLNEKLIKDGGEPVAFESDCREGICGNCGLVINGVAHGGKGGCTTCEVRMRQFTEGQTITVEPFRAKAFPIIKDLAVNRSAFDRIMSKGGYIAVNTGNAQDANMLPIHHDDAEHAMDAAACIGCGACVAACPNASASLFVGAKVSQYTWLPQGKVEAKTRVLGMVKQMDSEGFGDCSNHAECEAVCPKEISIANISRMRREYTRALLAGV